MSVEAASITELSPQQFTAQFQAGRVLVERAAQLTLEMDEIYTGFRKSVPIDTSQSSPDAYMPLLGAVPETAAAEYVRMLLARNGMNTAINRREARLNEAMKDRPVVVATVKPEGESPILKLAYRSNPIFGSGNELIGRPDTIQGTMEHVDLRDNTLLIRPRKLSLDASNVVTYQTPFLDKNGFPLITVEFREPTFRDNREPGRVAKFRQSMFGF